MPTRRATTVAWRILAKGYDANYAGQAEKRNQNHGPAGDKAQRACYAGEKPEQSVNAVEIALVLANVRPAHERASLAVDKENANDEQKDYQWHVETARFSSRGV